MSDTKKCPFCAEEVRAEAVKCKHCHEVLLTEKQTEEIVRHVKTSNAAWLAGFCAFIAFFVGAALAQGGDGIGPGIRAAFVVFWLVFVVVPKGPKPKPKS